MFIVVSAGPNLDDAGPVWVYVCVF